MSHFRINFCFHGVASLFILLFHRGMAQVGTITQEISTLQDFSLQPQCVQACFQIDFDVCPMDVLGIALGCATFACSTKGWQAKNDCYCRLDFQQPAQDHLDGCIKASCSVGDPLIAASSAGSIYQRYCEEKGYDITAPASIEATTTALTQATPTTRTRAGPTATSSEGTEKAEPAAKDSSGMSTATLVGIIIGAVLGTIILTVIAFRLRKWYKHRHPDLNPLNLALLNHQGKDVQPDDSVSNIGPLSQHSPHPQYYPQYHPQHLQHPPLPPDASLVSGGYASTVVQPYRGRGY